MGVNGRARVKEDGSAVYGAPLPEDGIHLFMFGDNIKLTKPTDDGFQSLMLTLAIDDKSDVENGARFQKFLNVKGDPAYIRTAEANLCTYLRQVGLADEMDEIFNDPDNLFDPNIIAQVVDYLAGNLAGKYIKLKTRQTGESDNRRVNIDESWPVSVTAGPSADKKETGKGSSGGSTGGSSGVSYG